MDKEEPYLLTGSPPCEAFSKLLNIKLASRDPATVKAKNERVVRRLHTAIGCYRKQMENGRYFLHEHPDGASSWKDEEVVRLQREEGVFTVEGPMCRWGMQLETRDGRKGYVFKRTRWVTNSRVLASILDGRCSNQTGHGNRTGAEPEHRHLTLIGGCAAMAAVYPPRLVAAVLKGIKEQMKQDKAIDAVALKFGGPVPSENVFEVTDMNVEQYEQIFDEVTGAQLPAELVAQGKKEEIDWVRSIKLYDKVPRRMVKERGKQIVRTR